MSVKEADIRQTTASELRPNVAVGSQDMRLSSREIGLGALSGLGAGLVMGIVAMIVAAASGMNLLAPFRDVAGAIFPAVLAADGSVNVATILLGVVVHFTIAIILGMIFTIIYSGLLKLTFNFGVPITMGLAYSWIIWMVARYIILPLFGTAVYEVPAFIIAHAVFGVSLGVFYPWLRSRGVLRNMA
jgi:hypothetical protein